MDKTLAMFGDKKPCDVEWYARTRLCIQYAPGTSVYPIKADDLSERVEFEKAVQDVYEARLGDYLRTLAEA